MAEEQKGAIPTTTMIDTTETPKKTPMLKLGRKRLGMNRTGDEQPEESKRERNLPFCPFK